MNREDVIRMAKEVGFNWYGQHMDLTGTKDVWKGDIERFAARIAEAERDRCAKIAEDAREDEEYGHAAFRCVQIAQDIRSLES